MSEKLFLTKAEYEELKQKLDFLINEELPRIAEDIAAAVSQGDLSENAEYDNAKEEQAKINQEIARTRNMLANASIIKQNSSNDTVDIGHTVTLEDLNTNETLTVTIVSFLDLSKRRDIVTVESPLGKELLGREVNETVVITAPIGELSYKVKKIEIQKASN